jgi:hypothetical protein
MSKEETIKAFSETSYPINPPLPERFYSTAHDERPHWQKEYLWDRPYIEVTEFSGKPEIEQEWLEVWPSGKRYDVSCLDGGAWDRPTSWGMFTTIDEALKCCEGTQKPI